MHKTLVRLVDECDLKAENSNRHDFVGLHAALGQLLAKRLGVKKAIEVMADIAQQGGLWQLRSTQEK